MKKVYKYFYLPAAIAALGFGVYVINNSDQSSSEYRVKQATLERHKRSASGQAVSASPAVPESLNAYAVARFVAPAGFDPSIAARLLSEASVKYPDIAMRSIYTAGIIKSLCDAGFSMEAWKMIDPNPGMLRRGQLSQFFASSKLEKSELLAKLQELGPEACWGVPGYLRRFEVSELKSLIQSGELKQLLGDNLQDANLIAGVVANTQLALTAASPEQKLDVMRQIIDLYNSDIIQNQALFMILNRDSVGDVFERWKLLEESGYKNKNRVTKFSDAMISNMVDQDALRTIDAVRQNLHADDTHNFQTAVKSWMKIDSSGALEWYHSKSRVLSNVEKNAFAAANFQMAMEWGDQETAESWLNQIADSGYRTALQVDYNNKK